MNKAHKPNLVRIAFVLIAVSLTVYLVSYVVMSRRGFADADKYGTVGFYFFPPENTDNWRFWNCTLVLIYYPLIVLDNLLGTGRSIGSEPMWSLALVYYSPFLQPTQRDF